MKSRITRDGLKELLVYDQETGLFTYRVSRGAARAGQRAGKTLQGYINIRLDGFHYQAHQLAWLYVFGEWPGQKQIDHINRNRADNRIANLRCVSVLQNMHNRGINRNNKSGHMGISWVSRERRWRAQITINRVHRLIGHFREKADAIKAYETVRKEVMDQLWGVQQPQEGK